MVFPWISLLNGGLKNTRVPKKRKPVRIDFSVTCCVSIRSQLKHPLLQ